MQKRFIRQAALSAAIERYGPAYAQAIEPAVFERVANGVWFDAGHPAYAAGRRVRAAMYPEIPRGGGERSGAKSPPTRTTPSRHPQSANRDWTTFGPVLWDKLHRWALAANLGDVDRWLAGFATQVYCGDCRRHWLEIVKKNPPPKNSNEALFAWTVARHNDVNRRIGKRDLTMEQARGRWGV